MSASVLPNQRAEPPSTVFPASPARLPVRLPHVSLTSPSQAPEAPKSIAETGLDPTVLCDLALKLTATVSSLSTQWASDQLRLSSQVTEAIFWQLKQDHLVEVLGQTGMFDYRYAATQRGRDHAKQLLEISGYVGPAPVSLEAYSEMLDYQVSRRPKPTFAEVRKALTSMVLPEQSIEVAGLAALSGRSLLLFGPAGNGKTSLGTRLHNVMSGELWIPHCIAIGSNIIRVYDQHLHTLIDADDAGVSADRRWVRIRPPLVTAGGEMTLDELDLSYSPSYRFYEVPPHLKANGGTFLIDDFGRQRMAPHELLNRWIIPLERQIDYLSLSTGQKIEVPFRLMLIVATNLNIAEVADPAFLRRAGYRLLLDKPTPENFENIFQRYAASIGAQVPSGLVSTLLDRYQDERRELRASEPKELIERARDICRLYERPFALDADILHIAWNAYFSQS